MTKTYHRIFFPNVYEKNIKPLDKEQAVTWASKNLDVKCVMQYFSSIIQEA